MVFIKVLAIVTLSSLVLSACKITQQTRQERIKDPIYIDNEQLPILIGDVNTVRSFRQIRTKETWFWSQLNNDTYLPGENVIVQVISDVPLKQPPDLFSFSVPESASSMSYNVAGPFHSWITTIESGEKCLKAHQNVKMNDYWISVFTHFCTQKRDQDLSWVNQFKLSPLLEGF